MCVGYAFGGGVHPSMSPKGVEHKNGGWRGNTGEHVHPSMSPKGVEHVNGRLTVELETLSASINVAERR